MSRDARSVASADAPGRPFVASGVDDPAVLKLNWYPRTISGNKSWFARTPFGSYRVCRDGEKWIAIRPTSSRFMSRKIPEQQGPTREAVQEWAQADFTERVRQCLRTAAHSDSEGDA